MKIKKICSLILAYIYSLLCFGQQTHYDISAVIDTNNVINATCKIDYINKQEKPLDTIFFHLFANAFSSNTTPYSQQSLRMNSDDFYLLRPIKKGHI